MARTAAAAAAASWFLACWFVACWFTAAATALAGEGEPIRVRPVEDLATVRLTHPSWEQDSIALAQNPARPAAREYTARLAKRWQARLALDGPTSVVVGRLGECARLCVQGTGRINARQVAAIEMLDDRGRSLWRDRHGDERLDYRAGAYLQWLPAGGADGPAVL